MYCHTGHLQCLSSGTHRICPQKRITLRIQGILDDPSIEEDSSKAVWSLDDLVANGAGQNVEPFPHPIQFQHPFGRYSDPNVPSRVLPICRTFTAINVPDCFKWRTHPDEEEILKNYVKHILARKTFFLVKLLVSGDLIYHVMSPTDITQDRELGLWAIDKPNIASTPSLAGKGLASRIRGRRK
ncbi:hypothetical protein NC652_016028 [Populus alba x Populus x berolinensis]|nr:hypothetical protein NC652_016028 [Populus alba x Populus x berolinensis]